MMIENSFEILLVEDNPNDVELTLHAMKKNHLANCIHVVRDGAEALDYIFASGADYFVGKTQDNKKQADMLVKLVHQHEFPGITESNTPNLTRQPPNVGKVSNCSAEIEGHSQEVDP